MNVLNFSQNIKDCVANLLALSDYTKNIRLDPIYGGGNNRAYLITTDNEHYFLKHYYQDKYDSRHRLKVEFSFSTFAWNHGISCIAKPISCDENNSIAIYEYIQGRKLSVDEIGDKEIKQALDFIIKLNEKRVDLSAQNLSSASEACFSLSQHIHLIDKRIEKLAHIIINDDIDNEVDEFIRLDLVHHWEHLKNEMYSKLSTDFLNYQNKEIEERILSPSDFGFHNALLKHEHDIRFFDFEYAGWDDPAKLVCDFFCQPAVSVPEKYFSEFTNTISILTINPELFFNRMQWLLPLTRIKWCCIILNCFLPDRKAQKQFSLSITDEYRVGQIIKARNLFDLARN